MGITVGQYERMRDRSAGKGRKAANVVLEASADHHAAGVILGVDPSLRGTGYGVIRCERAHPVALVHGTVRCPAQWDRSRCLAKIAEALRDVIRQYEPEVCAVEGLFYAQNLRTALIMGEARGAALVAMAEAGLEIYELAPRKVKQAIVGFGGAQKLAVAKMVQRMLCLEQPPSPDAADALAVALAHDQESRRREWAPLKRI